MIYTTQVIINHPQAGQSYLILSGN